LDGEESSGKIEYAGFAPRVVSTTNASIDLPAATSKEAFSTNPVCSGSAIDVTQRASWQKNMSI
jgi:hypothetical protein